MSSIEIIAPTLSRPDLEALERALALVERDSLAAKLTRTVGGRFDWIGKRLPSGAKKAVAMATESALKAALKVAIGTLRPQAKKAATGPASERWHKAAAAASGALGGAFGLAALALELPISTTILLRSIAEIARAEGEDLSTPEALLACLEVFALGDEPGESAVEGGYFAARAMLAQSVSESARFLLRTGLSGETAPVVVRLVSQIAARFGVAVSEKIAAQALPIVGAVGGAAINAAFADHFQTLARGHFVIRRLERVYGAEVVREESRRFAALRRTPG